MNDNGGISIKSRASGRVRILLMTSLLVLGACLVVTQFAGDDASAVQSHTGSLDEQGSAVYTYDDPVYPGLMMKAGSYDTKGVSFSMDDLLYEISGKDAVTVMGFAGYPTPELVIPTKVTSPDNVEYTVVKIAKDAFKGMIPLESVVIPDTVIELGKNAFMGCVSLKNLTVPVSVKCPHGSKDHAFRDIRLTRLVLTKGTDGLQRKDNDFWKSWKNSIEELVVDEGIRSITESFKDWKYLESVTLKDVESILEDQFRRCDSLVTVTAPKVRTVHDNAFMDCPRLNTVDLSSFESHTRGIFVRCPNLKTVVSEKLFIDNGQLFLILDNGNLSLIQQLDADVECVEIPVEVAPPSSGNRAVTEIGKEAFREHKNLEMIIIHDGVTKVDEHAFHDCKSLKEISIPIGIDCSYHTEKTAFEGVKPLAVGLSKGGYDPDSYMDNEFWKPWRGSLKSLTLNDGITDFRTSFKGKGLQSLGMVDIRTIHKNQFRDCKELTLAYIMGVEAISECAFKDCENIVFADGSGVREIGKEAFCGCEKLVDFTGDSVERIGEKAFYKCGTLRSFNLYNAKKIGTKAFWNTNVSPAETTSKKDAVKAFGKDDEYTFYRFINDWGIELWGAICGVGAVISFIVMCYYAYKAGSTTAFVVFQGVNYINPVWASATKSMHMAQIWVGVFVFLFFLGLMVYAMVKIHQAK